MVTHSAWDQDEARSIVAGLAHLEGAMLPMLHALQDAFGHVDPQAVPLIADALNLSPAEVHGTISFYHDFRAAPSPGRVIRLCRAEACQALGCEDLVEDLARARGVAVDAGADARGVSVETVYCLGNCALGPSALVEGELIGRLNAARLGALCGIAAGERA